MRYHTVPRGRRGFTLIELVIGMVVFGIVGALFTQLLTTQGRFFDKQNMGNSARNVSRATLNRVISDLRMIEATGGMMLASPTSITARIPFALGVVCGTNSGGGPPGTTTAVSILPVDSVIYNADGFYGYAWRSATTGAYTYVENGAIQYKNTGQSLCTTAGITTLTNGRLARLSPVVTGSSLGTPIFLYRKIRYEFKASTAVPGKLGLYRTTVFPDASEASEELVAPFANTAKFRFFVLGNNTDAQDNPPASLSDVRGLEIHLDGLSERAVPGSTSVESAPFTTAVFFKNRIQ
jgi:prepilin-type N-terminal cleavage/methylation domain-containing protein